MMVRALYPGSFDPIHNGHVDIAKRAARVFEEVVVGVYDFPKKKLLFDVESRLEMARHCFADSPNIRVAKFELEFRMGLANKKLAPEIETVSIMTDIQHIYISSSTIREIAELGGDVTGMVPPLIAESLAARFAELRASQGSPGYMFSIRD
jgi:pantetheine-phosphate adenylyltransferase